MVYQALVVGSGPGGLATVASLMDHGVEDIAWVDDQWCGGRLNGMYREISSNTKVGIYLDAMSSSATCKAIIDKAPKPNPVTCLEAIDRDETVQLSMAGDLIMFLIEGLLHMDKVKRIDGRVEQITYDSQDQTWTGSLRSAEPLKAKQVHLCTGSYPIVASFHERYNTDLKTPELDEVLRKSRITHLLDLDSKDPPPALTIGVIGNSHSGVLAIRNLYEVAQEHDLDMTIVSFERRPILYAEYREDGIVHDNTGLKGATAEWSKKVMEIDSPGDGRIKRVHLGRSEEEEKKVYSEWLPRCTHLVYAIGYHRSPTPQIRLDGEDVTDELEFDMHSSGFKRVSGSGFDDSEEPPVVPRLFGCGIAFPEEVEDPAGNVEAAVGVAKFYKFAERVGSIWVG